MAGAVPKFMPGDPKIWVYVTGGLFALSALGILTGFMKTGACYLLAGMLIVFVIGIHGKSFMDTINATDASGKMTKLLSMTSMLKDSALAMGAILIGNFKK
jgi:uncharacterized membrane protein YphA (DoxX/SURF4 family)